ncbi:hypothetical protein Q3G72_001530 [Acer saccharum]|nr:hypothetical protein Q3G72_001530 [Acer saccharum]
MLWRIAWSTRLQHRAFLSAPQRLSFYAHATASPIGPYVCASLNTEDNGAHRGMRRQTRMRLPKPAKTHWIRALM